MAKEPDSMPTGRTLHDLSFSELFKEILAIEVFRMLRAKFDTLIEVDFEIYGPEWFLCDLPFLSKDAYKIW